MTIITFVIVVWALFALCAHKNNPQFTLVISQGIKGICCVGIVLLHTIKSINQDVPVLYQEIEIWGPVIVGIFFALSGYGLLKIYKRSGGYISLWYKRIAKLLIPLVIGTCFYLILVAASGEFDFKQIGLDMKDGLMPLPFSWFCYVILFLYIGFYVIFSIKTQDRVKIGLLLVYVLLLSGFLRMVMGFGSHWYISNLAFVVGAIIGAIPDDRISSYAREKKTALCITIIVSAILSVIWFTKAPQYGLPQLSVVFVTILPIVVILLSFLFFKTNMVLSFLGKISYEVYLAHGIVIWALVRFHLPIVIYIVLVLVLAILLGFVGNRINSIVFRWLHIK